jgi:hypothetical protein
MLSVLGRKDHRAPKSAIDRQLKAYEKLVKAIPEQSVSRLGIGQKIGLRRAQFESLSKAFFAETQSKFL